MVRDAPNPFPEGASDEDEDIIRAANDHFFQGYYGIEDASRGFLQPTILSELSESLDWEGAPMELVRGLFVDPRLRFKSSDLLWKVITKSGDETYVLLSFDHQTRPDKWMALRCLAMQSSALLKILGEDEGKPKSDLPVIYCVVLYQGLEPWSAPLEFQDLVNLAAFPEESREKIREYVPKFRYQLVPLQTTPDEELPDHTLTRLGLKLMQAAILHTVADWVRESGAELALLLQREDSEYIFALIFNYAAQKTRNKEELESLNQAIESLDQPVKQVAMNGAQILEARGEARGKAETLMENARKMLARDFEAETVADILEVPIELVTKMAQGEEPILEEWIAANNPGS